MVFNIVSHRLLDIFLKTGYRHRIAFFLVGQSDNGDLWQLCEHHDPPARLIHFDVLGQPANGCKDFPPKSGLS
jgi:hypothetical protein